MKFQALRIIILLIAILFSISCATTLPKAKSVKIKESERTEKMKFIIAINRFIDKNNEDLDMLSLQPDKTEKELKKILFNIKDRMVLEEHYKLSSEMKQIFRDLSMLVLMKKVGHFPKEEINKRLNKTLEKVSISSLMKVFEFERKIELALIPYWRDSNQYVKRLSLKTDNNIFKEIDYFEYENKLDEFQSFTNELNNTTKIIETTHGWE